MRNCPNADLPAIYVDAGCLRLFSPRQDQLQDNSDRDIRGGLPPLPQRDGDWPVRKRRRVLLYGK